METAPSEGLLSAWLRRNTKVAAAPDPGTPTWSEASEGSMDEDASALSNTVQSVCSPAQPASPARPTSPVQPERVSWLTRLSGAYNVAGTVHTQALLRGADAQALCRG